MQLKDVFSVQKKSGAGVTWADNNTLVRDIDRNRQIS